MPIRLETLGGLRILIDGVERPALTGQRLRCGLLVYTATERTAPRERVLDLFWPDRTPEKGRHALSQMLYELRRDLGEDCVRLEGDKVVASAELVGDALEFQSAVARVPAEAARLYRGPFLDAVRLAHTPGFERWVDDWRSNLKGLFGSAQRERVSRLDQSGDLEGALVAARRWVLAEPVDDEARLRLITLLARSGLRNEAIRQFEDYRSHLEEFGAKPLAELSDLVEDIREARYARDPAGSSLLANAPQLGASARVLVLPFEDMSAEGEYDHFCDGLVEEIISSLSRVSGLRVAPRTSAFAFRGARILDAATTLGVTHAVEGSARFSTQRYRVTVRLIEAMSEAELWQDQLQGDLTADNIFEVQDRIAQSVSEALQRRLATARGRTKRPVTPTSSVPRRRPTSNMGAFDLYLRGRQAWFKRTFDGFSEALQLFEEAAEADPTYAQAYSGIADVFCLLAAFDYAALPPSHAYPKARVAAERALAIDPDLASAHAALGNVVVSHDWDLEAGEGHYRRAIELDPGYSVVRQWYSLLLCCRGRDDAALTEAVLALELDPRSAHLSGNLARLFQLQRQPQRAAEQFRHALTLDDRFVTAHMGLALAELRLGKEVECLDRLDALAERLGDGLTLVQALRGYALGVSGRHKEARSVAQWLKATSATYLPPEHVAVVYIGLGEIDRAVKLLEQARDAKSQAMTLLGVEPILDPLRGHPDFKELASSVGV